MKKLVIAVFAAALIGAPLAFADPPDNHDKDHHDTMGDHHDNKMDQHHDSMQGGMMGHDMHHPVHHGWKHGDHLPQMYWHYSEIDWNHYHLRRPPHGYHWIRVDDDFVLVAIGTGVILDTVFAQ